MLRTLSPLAFTAALFGCVSVPDGAAPMCHVDSDCDHLRGEVCQEGVCWGNPPPGTFAAVVSPPSTRHDLIPRELSRVDISASGWISGGIAGGLDDIALDAPVLLSGRLTSFCPLSTPCDPMPLGGTVTVSRASRFHGGPGFTAVVNVRADATFSIAVPRTESGDEHYTVTIVPETGEDLTDRTASQLVPPRRLQVPISDNTATQAFVLGAQDLPTLSGQLVDSRGFGISGYRVSALGRWDENDAPGEVSTVAFTDSTGKYTITLSDGLTGVVDLVARPARNGLVAPPIAPAVRVGNLDAQQSAIVNITTPGDFGNPTQLSLTVIGVDISGKIGPATGAQVQISGTSVDAATGTSFTVSDEQVVDAAGRVTLNLLDGRALASAYRLSITPRASSILGAVFAQPVTLASLAASPQIRLLKRVALTGRVHDASGKPVQSATVTARPSLRFLWTLDAAPQAFVAALPAAAYTTGPDGAFSLWVDPSIAQVYGHYDLVIEPPASLQVPAYRIPEVEIPGTPTIDTVALHDIALPDAAFVHGRVTGPRGEPVVDAELKLYRVSTELALCSQVQHAPASCPIPAQIEARNTSASDGTVRLVLPR